MNGINCFLLLVIMKTHPQVPSEYMYRYNGNTIGDFPV